MCEPSPCTTQNRMTIVRLIADVVESHQSSHGVCIFRYQIAQANVICIIARKWVAHTTDVPIMIAWLCMFRISMVPLLYPSAARARLRAVACILPTIRFTDGICMMFGMFMIVTYAAFFYIIMTRAAAEVRHLFQCYRLMQFLYISCCCL